MIMNRSLWKGVIATMFGGLLFSTAAIPQIFPPAKKGALAISQGPAVEIAVDYFAIIRWTTTTPGGSDEHFGVVHYGTDPETLIQIAKSHIRLNRSHAETIFRVRVNGLVPRTTYFYTVASMESSGKSDGVESQVSQFTTPGPGERIVNGLSRAGRRW
jgi:hypothetical protein